MGVGAFLPCYWIYLEVGKVLEAKGSPNLLYQRWIETYSSAEYESVVRQAIAAADKIAETLADKQREAMKHHFVVTSKMEWMFWDMSYRKESWAI